MKHIDLAPIIDGCIRRSWRGGEANERQVLALVFGPDAPYARARKWLPALARWVDGLFPEGPIANAVVDYRDPNVEKIVRENLEIAVRTKLVAAEFLFTSRADLGLFHILLELGARVNNREIWRRVSTAPGVGLGSAEPGGFA